jgi:hypothetical protein
MVMIRQAISGSVLGGLSPTTAKTPTHTFPSVQFPLSLGLSVNPPSELIHLLKTVSNNIFTPH